MSRIVETEVFQFEELSDRAKEKARDWYRQTVFSDSNDWDSIYEWAATAGALMGIDIRQKAVKTMGGGTRYDPAIYFSGFSSQGDGACFEGDYAYAKGAAKALAKEFGDTSDASKELIRIANALQAIQRRYFYGLTARMTHSGRYYHSGCMSVSVDDRTGYGAPAEVDEEVTQLMRDFADWIYDRLDDEHDHLTSDESVDENIRINEYEFDEDGNIN